MIVLTGFYNAENYIERCLTTIKTQDYKDFTLIRLYVITQI